MSLEYSRLDLNNITAKTVGGPVPPLKEELEYYKWHPELGSYPHVPARKSEPTWDEASKARGNVFPQSKTAVPTES